MKKRYALALPPVCRQIYTETAFFVSIHTRPFPASDFAQSGVIEFKHQFGRAMSIHSEYVTDIYTQIYANNNFVFYETSDAAYWLRRKNQAQISVIRRIEVYKQHLCSPDDYARLGPVRNRLAHLISDIYWHLNPGCYGDIVFFERDS